MLPEREANLQFRGVARNFLSQGLTFPTGGLNQTGKDHALLIISLFEGQKHVIFRTNNRDSWLETVYF